MMTIFLFVPLLARNYIDSEQEFAARLRKIKDDRAAKAAPSHYSFFFVHCSMRSSAVSKFAIEFAVLKRM